MRLNGTGYPHPTVSCIPADAHRPHRAFPGRASSRGDRGTFAGEARQAACARAPLSTTGRCVRGASAYQAHLRSAGVGPSVDTVIDVYRMRVRFAPRSFSQTARIDRGCERSGVRSRWTRARGQTGLRWWMRASCQRLGRPTGRSWRTRRTVVQPTLPCNPSASCTRHPRRHHSRRRRSQQGHGCSDHGGSASLASVRPCRRWTATVVQPRSRNCTLSRRSLDGVRGWNTPCASTPATPQTLATVRPLERPAGVAGGSAGLMGPLHDRIGGEDGTRRLWSVPRHL